MFVKVHTVPDSRKEKFTQDDELKFTIAVREKAQRNMANDRVRELLALHYKKPVASVRLVTGHRSPAKIYSIE